MAFLRPGVQQLHKINSVSKMRDYNPRHVHVRQPRFIEFATESFRFSASFCGIKSHIYSRKSREEKQNIQGQIGYYVTIIYSSNSNSLWGTVVQCHGEEYTIYTYVYK